MNYIDEMESTSIGKLLWKFSLPAIVGMFVMASYNIVDRIFVGRGVGSIALSAVSVMFPLIAFLIGIGMLIGLGAATFVSIRLGEKKKEEAELFLGNAFTLTLIVSLLLTLVVNVFLHPILILFGATPDMMPYAVSFTKVLSVGFVLHLSTFTLNNIIRSQGDPKTAMNTMLISAGLNIILNPIMIMGLHLGIQGSAIATIISQFVSAIWVFMYYLRKRSLLHLKLSNMKLRWDIVKKIASVGFSPFLMQAIASVVIILYNNQLMRYGGEIAIASFGIVFSISQLFFMPIFGINQGSQPIIGYNYGAKRIDRIKKAVNLSLIAATSICVFWFIIVMLFNKPIVHLFVKDDAVLINLTIQAMLIVFLTLPIDGLIFITGTYFQSIGNAKKSFLVTSLRQVLLQIPLLLILPSIFHLSGVWWVSPISEIGTFAFALFFMLAERKRLDNMEKAALTAAV